MRLIDADKLIKELEYAVSSDKLTSYDDMFDIIERFPTADVQPVQHGRWIEQRDTVKPMRKLSLQEKRRLKNLKQKDMRL